MDVRSELFAVGNIRNKKNDVNSVLADSRVDNRGTPPPSDLAAALAVCDTLHTQSMNVNTCFPKDIK
jgi:hypothetical protein